MSGYHCPDAKTLQSLKDIANQLRIHSVNMTQASNSGHPTSCASIAEIMSVLFFHTMKLKPSFPRDPSSDRFILSKGHAAPILYAAWAEVGVFPSEDLLNLRKLHSDLEGHPTPRLNFIDVATGSLGQGLSVAAGMAYVGKYIDKAQFRVYCVIGDGESAEGSIWEAMSFASYYKLDNLVAIFDVNRLGQSEPAPLQHQTDVYRARAEAFGWQTEVVDGHSVDALCKSFYTATTVTGKPFCVVAKTFKGMGFLNDVCDQLNWHGKALGPKAEKSLELVQAAMSTKGPWKLQKVVPDDVEEAKISNIKLSEPPNYTKGEKVAVRFAYGVALAKIGKNNDRVVAMDGDTKNSTFSDKFKKEFPDRYIECFIAEQNLVGVAIGCATRDRTVAFCSTFAAFFTRAFDQIRMGAISQTNVNFAGSHAGISIGEDGPSQMALEDLAMFRSIPGSTVFYPSDAVSAERAVELAANRKGVCFIRTSRPALPVLYDNNEVFEPGKAKSRWVNYIIENDLQSVGQHITVSGATLSLLLALMAEGQLASIQIVHKSDSDVATVIGCCVTLVEALKAADELAKQGINIRVVDPFTLKPFDKDLVLDCAKQTGGNIVTVEDHYLWGGLGDTVSGCLSEERGILIKKLAVTEVPRSGQPAELLAKYGIDSNSIMEAVKNMVQGQKAK